jgi:hypothetical protein
MDLNLRLAVDIWGFEGSTFVEPDNYGDKH